MCVCERKTERETETGTLKEIDKRNGYGGKIETSIETQCTSFRKSKRNSRKSIRLIKKRTKLYRQNNILRKTGMQYDLEDSHIS